MSTSFTYTASKIIPGEADALREHSFTRWTSRDLTQAATDFCKNIGLCAIYVETSADGRGRKIFWNRPGGAMIEIRSGGTGEQFEELDRKNLARNLALLSLHINEQGIHSAVWISGGAFATAVAVLRCYGIAPAERHPA